MLVAVKEGSCALVCSVGGATASLAHGPCSLPPGGRLGCWVLAQLIGGGNSNSSDYFIIQATQGGSGGI